MGKTKFNYAIMRSMFGDLWIGKTKLPIKKDKIFKNLADASSMAETLFLENHSDFDTDDEDNNDMDLQQQYEKLLYPSEEDGDIEEIRKEMEKFII